jgi:hypothetical protein
MPDIAKLNLIRKLGYNIDNAGFITRDGRRITDRCTGKPVQFSRMAIIAGTIIDDNPISIASYLEDMPA